LTNIFKLQTAILAKQLYRIFQEKTCHLTLQSMQS